MTRQIPEVVAARIDWRVFTIMGDAIPPRDPDDDEEDEDEEDDEEDQTDEAPVVREPDED